MPNRAQPGRTLHDTALAMRLRDGDEAAYTAVFETYYLPLVQFLLRYLDSRDAAEDVAQDVLLRLWEGHASVDPGRSLKAYLFAAARNRALDLLAHRDMARRRVTEVLHELGDEAEVSPDVPPDAELTASELLQMADARVAMLSPRLREVYHLSRREGLTAAEIADVLGTSVHTVYAQLAKVAAALYPVLRAWMEE